MVMEITHFSGFWRCLSKEDFNTLATGEEEANIGVSLSAWSVVKSWSEEISTFV